GQTAGSVSITETAITQAVPAGYSFLGQQINITAPPGTITNPLIVKFQLDGSVIPAGQNEKTLQVFKDGALVLACAGAPTAVPDPCVSNRALLTGGKVELTVLSSTASAWNVGASTTNTAPVAADDSYSINEETPLVVPARGVLGNDQDLDENTLTAALVAGPAHGTLTLNANGSFTYTPTANYNGPDSFTYKANDGSLDSNVATVAITVTAVNNPPVAANDSVTTDEDTPLTIAAPGVLGNDSDSDSATITALLVAGPRHGEHTSEPHSRLT